MKRIPQFRDYSVRTICSYVVRRVIMGFKRKRSKIFQNHLYGQLVLTFDQAPKIRASCRVFERTCLEPDLRFSLITILLICLDFKVFVRLVYAAFWVLLHAVFMYGWKQRAQRKRLNEQSTQEIYIDETFAETFLFTNTSFERELSLKTLSCPADQQARRLCVWDCQLTTSWMCNIRWQVPKLTRKCEI